MRGLVGINLIFIPKLALTVLYASSIFIVNAVPIRIISFFTASIIQLSPRYHNIVRFLGLVITTSLGYLCQQ